MGKALDFRAGGPRFKSHLSQYLPNFYWNFLKSGITGQGQIMCFFEFLRSRAFRIYGFCLWELKFHKIRRQGTVYMVVQLHIMCLCLVCRIFLHKYKNFYKYSVGMEGSDQKPTNPTQNFAWSD